MWGNRSCGEQRSGDPGRLLQKAKHSVPSVYGEPPPAGVRRSRSVTAGHGVFVGKSLLRRAALWRPRAAPVKGKAQCSLCIWRTPACRRPALGKSRLLQIKKHPQRAVTHRYKKWTMGNRNGSKEARRYSPGLLYCYRFIITTPPGSAGERKKPYLQVSNKARKG